MGAIELEEYQQQIEKIKAEARELTAGLDRIAVQLASGPDQWSIEECLSHLTMVGQWELRAIEEAVERGRAAGSPGRGPFSYGPIERFIVDMTRPPVRTKLPAPKRFVPLHGQPVTAIMPTFLHVQNMFQLQMQRAEGLDLARVKVADTDLAISADEPGRHVCAGGGARTAASGTGAAGARKAAIAPEAAMITDLVQIRHAGREEARGKHALSQVHEVALRPDPAPHRAGYRGADRLHRLRQLLQGGDRPAFRTRYRAAGAPPANPARAVSRRVHRRERQRRAASSAATARRAACS